jgi:hypothetical protein
MSAKSPTNLYRKHAPAIRRRNAQRAEIIRAFATLKEHARGWLASLPYFVRVMTADELRLMADCFDGKPGASEAFRPIDLAIQRGERS